MSETINIFVRHSPLIKIRSHNGKITVPRGFRLSELLRLLGIPPAQQPYLLVTVNQEKRALSCELRENDSVKVLMPIGGG